MHYGRMAADEEERPLQESMVTAGSYYKTYFGHDCAYLEQVLRSLRELHGAGAPAVFLAGDSTLDNKTWLFNQGAPAQNWRPDTAHAPAINGYERILSPPRMICDVTYWLNYYLSEIGNVGFAVNTAIEATLLATRVGGVHTCCIPACGCLYEQDEFIRDNIKAHDLLVISVGGNDIALAPSILTIVALVLLMLTPWPLLGAWHPAVAYFICLFRHQVQCYAEKLTSKVRPAKVAVCMVYNLDERNGNSWANGALCLLCYCCFPAVLQARMRLAFQLGVARVEVSGTEVVPVHLADALDGKCTEDYHHRVEPSVMGGRKMAQLVLHRLGLPVHGGSPQ